MKDQSEFTQNPEQISNSSISEPSEDAVISAISAEESVILSISPQQSILLPSSSDVFDSVSDISPTLNAENKPINLSKCTITESQTVIVSTNSDTEDKEPKKWQRYLGLLLAVLSAFMFSINALIFKILNYSPPLVPATYMFLGTAIFTLPLFLYNRYQKSSQNDNSQKIQIDWKTRTILLTRAFTGCSGMLLFLYSLQYLSIGDALVIACSSPVFVFLLAWIFLKESCGLVPVVTIVLALLGVVIITRPPLLSGEESFKQDDLIGAGLAFASMISIASTLVLMRYLQNVHYSIINLTSGVWGTLQSAGLALFLDKLTFPRSPTEALIVTGAGLVFSVGQNFLALSLQLEHAGPVSLLRTSEVIFAFGWQLLFLNVVPDSFSIYGTVFIMIGIITTILRKWIGSLPATHAAKQKFGFLLK